MKTAEVYKRELKLGFAPSIEQVAFLNWIEHEKGSSILEAVAGSGKTSSLIMALRYMKGSVFLGAFNKDIATELKSRIPAADAWRIQAATMHSAGLMAIKRSGRKPRTEPGKLRFLLDDIIGKVEYTDPRKKAGRQITNLASLAKQHGFDVISHGSEVFPKSTSDEAWHKLIDHFDIERDLPENISLTTVIHLAKQLLKKSNQSEAIIDFDDMIYLPLLFNFSFQPYDWVLLDEAQDTNVVRREMAFRMLKKPAGRLVAVGDPHQAIYGFTGADANALDNIRRRAKAATLPLSVSWRCSKAVVAEARKVVSHINAAPAAPEGSVSTVPFDEFFVDRLRPGDAVLCRLNRPNVATAIACLRANKPARIVGRDLGERLLSHARKAAPDKPGLLDLGPAVDQYQRAEIARLERNGKESSVPFFEDEMEALMLLIDRCLEQGQQRYDQLEALCQFLFINPDSQAHAIIFSSVHKSKGLEWPKVYLLGKSDYMPFFMAQQDWQLEQENNLIYVAETRAKLDLVFVTDVRSALDTGVHRAQKAKGAKAELPTLKPMPVDPESPNVHTEVAKTIGFNADLSILEAMLNPKGAA